MTNQHTIKRPIHKCECGNHAWVTLTRGYSAFIDQEDAEFLGQWSWAAHVPKNKKITAVRRENSSGQIFYMHRVIANPADGEVVDHINGNTLDNRRSNLRACLQRDNSRNRCSPRGKLKTSRFKGVWKDKIHKGWLASIRVNYRTLHLGAFPTEELAAIAYDNAAKLHFGEFANTNEKLGLLPKPLQKVSA